MNPRRLCALALFSAALFTTAPAAAQPAGFQVNRYEPTAAGEWGFAVDHPWYSATRYFAAGLTLNYGHNPLVLRRVGSDGTVLGTTSILEHQLLGHLDLAGSFLDRVNVSLSLPVTLLEQGQALVGVTPTAPAIGDPRLGALVRIFGQPDASPVSLSIGGYLWVPLRSQTQSDLVPPQASDSAVRGLPKLVLAGAVAKLRWSASLGFMLRPSAQLGGPDRPDGATVGNEAQIGALLQYADRQRSFAVGPEFLLSTRLSQNSAQAQTYTSMELLLGGQYNIAQVIQVGLAAGVGLLREAGTPDARALFRLAYAPLGKPVGDRDRDRVLDDKDRCPDEAQGADPDPERPGCPLGDRDSDGIYDRDDLCPSEPSGLRPDPQRRGCPLADKDSDGVVDREDLCPETAAGPNPDPARRGCPRSDRDGDGVSDSDDLCPELAQGPHPDPGRQGCPDSDSDQDGVYDAVDQCKDVAAGLSPDPKRPGCPVADRDADSVPDDVDACPDAPGVPSADPKKSGCPGLISLTGSTIQLSQQVFFDYNRDVILKVSFPLLTAVADLLKLKPELKRVEVQGHTDNKGPSDYNLELSDRRAQSVVRFLIEQGVDSSRLSSRGYGDTQPVGDNQTVKGRGRNRRVIFLILDPPQSPSSAAPTAAVTPPPGDPPAKAAKNKGAKKKAKRKKPAAL